MKEKAFQACMDVIAQEGWNQFSFAKASDASGIPLTDFHTHFSVPLDVMAYLFYKIDKDVLDHLDLGVGLAPKDALFDILMARFESAQPYKLAIERFWQDCLLDPRELPPLLCQGFSSMGWMLEAAGLSSRGLKGMLRVQGLTTLYLLTLRTWFEDESPDLGKTMVFLDEGLIKLEKVAEILRFF